MSAVAACGQLRQGPHAPAVRPSPADAALAPVDDRAAFQAIDARLDRVTDSRVRDGNRVELLVDGVTSFARRRELARGADLILVKTFAFVNDDTGREIAALLEERARAGAYVVVQYDVIGSIHGNAEAEQIALHGEPDVVRELREAGVVVVAANAPGTAIPVAMIGDAIAHAVTHPFEHLGMAIDAAHRLDFHDHEKYWITGHVEPDGGVKLAAIVGGMNIASEYALGGSATVDSATGARGWHDVDVEIEGPAVNDILARFLDVMDAQLGRPRDAHVRARWNVAQPAAGTARVRLVYNHPWFGNRRAIEELYGALIDAVPAGGVARIETAYFAPGTQLRRHLRAALHRGARLAVISNLETNDTAPVAEGTWFAYRALLDVAPAAALYARVARPDLGEVMLHCKVASFGTTGPVIIGSANLDAQSAEHNSEDVLVIDDHALRERFDAMFEQDLAPDRARRITSETLDHESAWDRLRHWAVWNTAWYWL